MIRSTTAPAGRDRTDDESWDDMTESLRDKYGN